MIRKATDADRSALGKIYCDSWRIGYTGILLQQYLDSLTVENFTTRKVSSGNTYVCERDGMIVGLVKAGSARLDEYKESGDLHSIYVIPEYWRQGVGRELFESAEKLLEGMGFDRFYLWVLYDNARARSFYEKMGMRSSGVCKTVEIGGCAVTEIRYICELKV